MINVKINCFGGIHEEDSLGNVKISLLAFGWLNTLLKCRVGPQGNFANIIRLVVY